MRMVDPIEWDLSGMRNHTRAERLQDAPQPETLVTRVAQEALEAAENGRCQCRWQLGELMSGCGRAIAVIPISQDVFDALFNGRSGYRAQYYLSCDEGIHFNCVIMGALHEPLRIARELADLSETFDHSFTGPWSKIWVEGDDRPFQTAAPDDFRPRRWVKRLEGKESFWLRAPLPDQPAIEVKGTWVSSASGQYKQDISKVDRHCCLAERGFA